MWKEPEKNTVLRYALVGAVNTAIAKVVCGRLCGFLSILRYAICLYK